MMPISIRIKDLRRALGWSQAEVSRRTGIRQATISAIENGQTKGIDFDTLEALADVFEVDPALLIKREERP
jgi:transcriptional regulator with XRE-family HTH domain